MMQEIRRIEGQLLVAKQICRENAKEIRQLKEKQEQDLLLQEANRLLSIKSLHTHEHAQQFNELLRSVYQQQRQQTELASGTKLIETKIDRLLIDLSSNVSELESVFDHAKTLLTQPITSIDLFNNTMSLQQLPDNQTTEQHTILIDDLQKRIDTIHMKLVNIDQNDECIVQ